MFKSLALIFLLCFGFNLFSQNLKLLRNKQNFSFEELEYRSDLNDLYYEELIPEKAPTGVNQIFIYSYETNKKGNVTDSVLLEANAYDRKGNIIEHTQYYFGRKMDRNNNIIKYTKVSTGNLIRSRIKYYYKEGLLDSISYAWENPYPDFKYYKILHDEKSRITDQICIKQFNDTVQHIKYYWDDHDRLIRKRRNKYYHENDTTIVDSKTAINANRKYNFVYLNVKYDFANYRVEIVKEDSSVERIMQFDKQWRIISTHKHETLGPWGEPFNETCYTKTNTFDSNGNLIASSVNYTVNEQLREENQITLEYNEQGDLLKSTKLYGRNKIFIFETRYDQETHLLVESKKGRGRSKGRIRHYDVKHYSYSFFEN